MGGVFRRSVPLAIWAEQRFVHGKLVTDRTITAPAATATAAALVPTIGNARTITAPPAIATASIPTPDGADAEVGPPLAVATASAPAPTITASSGTAVTIVAPPAQAWAIYGQGPLIFQEDMNPGIPGVAPDAVAATAAAAGIPPVPGIRITVPPATAIASAPAPSRARMIAEATATAPAPAIGITITVPVATATASAAAPGTSRNIQIPAAVAIASVTAPVPGMAITVVVATATAAGIAPTIINTAPGPKTIFAPVATAFASAPVPQNFTLEAWEGPETTVTWNDLLRESKDPGEREEVSVGTDRWLGGR